MTNKWPSYIVTTAKDVRMVTPKVEKVLHSGNGLYYGFTWNQDNLFLLARDGRRQHGFPDIFVLDINYKEIKTLPGSFLEGHQMSCNGDLLYVTKTAQNEVACIDLLTEKTRVYNWTGHSQDVDHINSVWKDKDTIWVGYHTNSVKKNKDSIAVRVDLLTGKLLEEYEVGKGIHNVIRIGNTLYICSSAEGKLLVYDLKTKSVIKSVFVGNWLRGIGITDDKIVVASTSMSDVRSYRLTGDSEVFLLDRPSLSILDKRVLQGTGSIYELRIIGEKDLAHNGIQFPGVLY